MKQWQIRLIACCLAGWLVGGAAWAETTNVAKSAGETAAAQELPAATEVATGEAATSVGKAELHRNEERGEYLVWTLADIREDDPTSADFRLGSVALGSDFAALKKAFGVPERRVERDGSAQWYWPGVTASVQRSLPYDAATAERIGVDPIRTVPGLAQLTVEKEAYPAARGIAVGNSRENIIRVYGAPTEVRWEPQTGVTNYIYRAPAPSREELIFRIRQMQIEAITLRHAPQPAATSAPLLPAPGRLAGVALQEVFTQPPYTDWDYRIDQDYVQVWLYPDFGVTLDKESGRTERVFLRSNHVSTAKGIALGDSLSTILRAYGAPTIVAEQKEDSLQLCYYPLPQRDAYLVFVVNTEKDQAEDIILTTSTIRQVLPREARYGLETEETGATDER